MPDRVIRDELLTSDRWLALENAHKLAFLACLLHADTLGNMEATGKGLERLWRDFGIDDQAQVNATLAALEQQDLARPYTDADGKRYLHLPRFRQHRRYAGRLRPLSPWTTDEEKQWIKNNSHSAHTVQTPSAPSANTEHTQSAPLGVGVGVEKDMLRSGVGVVDPPANIATDDQARQHIAKMAQKLASKFTTKPLEEIIQEEQKPKPNGAMPPKGWHATDEGTDKAGKLLNLPAKPGESYYDWRRRIFTEIAERQRGASKL